MGSEGEKRSVGREQQSRFPIDPLRHGVFPQAAEKVLKGVLAARRVPDDDILSALIRTPCLSDLRGKSFFLRMYSQIAHDLDRLPGDMPF